MFGLVYDMIPLELYRARAPAMVYPRRALVETPNHLILVACECLCRQWITPKVNMYHYLICG